MLRGAVRTSRILTAWLVTTGPSPSCWRSAGTGPASGLHPAGRAPPGAIRLLSRRWAVVRASAADPAAGAFTAAGTRTGAAAAEHPVRTAAARTARLAIVPADTLLRRIITLAVGPNAPMHR